MAGARGGKGKIPRGRGHPSLPAAKRPWHKAYRKAQEEAKRSAAAPRGRRRSPAGAPETPRSRPPRRSGAELVMGRNPVVEALRAEVPAATLYVAAGIDSDDRVRASLRIAADRGVPVMEIPRPQLDRLAGGAAHQGLAVQVRDYDYTHPDELVERADGNTPLIVALDGVTDPRNLGAVVRSVAAFGGHGVVVPERRAAGMTAGAWKASAGAAARVPVARATNLTRALKGYQRAGLLVVGLDTAGQVELSELAAATEPLVIVIGSEGKGLSRLVSETCDLRVRIPIASAADSLNAGVAAGIALYEVDRRRHAKP